MLPITNIKALNASKQRFRRLITQKDVSIATNKQYALNSEIAISADWNQFLQFTQMKNVQPLPASITAIRLYLEHEGKQRKFSTLKRYINTISLIHFLHGYSEPKEHPKIGLLMNHLMRDKLGDAVQAIPFTRKHLMQLCSQLSSSKSLKDKRDLAIYCLMFECLLKRGELRDLTLEHIKHDSDSNEPKITVNINETSFRLTEESGNAVHDWLQHVSRGAHAVEGIPLFRSINRHGDLSETKLNDSSIFRIIQRASTLIGLPQEQSFSAQSFRIGATKHLNNQGQSVLDIQTIGRWKSPVMPYQYIGRTGISIMLMNQFKPKK